MIKRGFVLVILLVVFLINFVNAGDVLYSQKVIGAQGNEIDLNNIENVDGYNSELQQYLSFKENSISMTSFKENNSNISLPKGYIIEFKEKPLVVVYSELKKEADENKQYIETHSPINPVRLYKQVFSIRNDEKVRERVDSHASKVKREHENVKSKIFSDSRVRNSITANAVNENQNIDEDSLVINEFDSVFNGIVLDVDEKSAEEIKKVEGVKSVYPNLEVKAFLQDSVPLIGADKVWQMGVGGESLTGENITIAVIDTGVDYTHPDLGGCFGDGEKFSYPTIGNRKINAIVVTMGAMNSINGFSDPSTLLEKTEESLFVNLNNYLIENSYGKLSVSGKVMGVYDIGEGICDLPTHGERVNEIVERAISAAINNGEQIDTDAQIIVFHPFPGCEFSNSPKQIMTFNEFVVAHEFGHSLGYAERFIGHVSSLYCENNGGQYEILSNNCEEQVYDPYDIMGMGWPTHFNSINKEIFGWLNDDNFVITNSGTYTITPLEVGNNGLKAIKVPLPNMKYQIYIEFRTPNKVIVHTKRKGFFSNYFVLPNEDSKYNYLLVGQDYTIGEAGITINVEEINDDDWARISISSEDLSQTQCNDGIDNDEWTEWLYDSNDFSCLNNDGVYDGRLLSEFEPLPGCGDNIDNDKDGLIDTADPDCPNSQYAYEGTSLECKVVGGYDFVNNDNDPMDDHGHGTHVAGTAAGNGILKGVAPDAKIYAYKVLDSGGGGTWEGVIAGIERAIDPNNDSDYSDHVDVISMSLGGNGDPDDPVSTAVDNAVDVGVVAVIAAGNSGPSEESIGSPGTARKAITVGATYKKNYTGQYWQDVDPRVNQITSFSSRGPVVWTNESGVEERLMKPDVVAPGAIICAARYGSIFPEGQHHFYYPCIDEKHVQLAGTSMATPIVSGMVALLIQQNRSLSSLEIKEKLKSTSVDLGYDENVQGSGLINGFNLFDKEMVAFIEPGVIMFELNPTNRILSNVKKISLKSRSFVERDFVFSIDNNINGAVFSLDKNNARLNANQEVELNISSIIDIDSLDSNKQYISYLLVSSSDYNLKVPIIVFVKHRLSLDNIKIDLGLDIPNQPLWKKEFNITLTNLRMDAGQSYSASIKIDKHKVKDEWGDFGEDNTLDISSKFSVSNSVLEFNPFEEKKLSITAYVDNDNIPNGVYSGKLILDSLNDKIEVPISFIKYYELVIDLANKTENKWVVWVYLQNNETKTTDFFVVDNRLPYRAYLDKSGIYDLISLSYVKEKSNFYIDPFWMIAHYVKPDIFVNGTDKATMDLDEAKYYFRLNISDENSNLVNTQFFGVANFYNEVDGFWGTWYSYFYNGDNVFKYNVLPRGYNITLNFANICKSDMSDSIYCLSDTMDNFDSDVNFGEGVIYGFVNLTLDARNVGEVVSVYAVQNEDMAGTCRSRLSSAFTNSSNSEFVFLINQSYFANSGFYAGMANKQDEGYEEYIRSPILSVVRGKLIKSLFNFNDFKWLEETDNKNVFVGIGPDIWLGKFKVWDNGFYLGTVYESSWRWYFTMQEYAQYNHGDMPYQVYSNSGTLVEEGLLYGGSLWFSPHNKYIELPSSGRYLFKVIRDYKIRNETLYGEVNVAFDSSLDDKNPPSIKSLKILCDGFPCDVLSNDTLNEIIFSADPNGGVLSEVSVQYLSGSVWRDADIVYNGEYYRANLTEFQNGAVVINISISDDSNNIMNYEFSVLAGLIVTLPILECNDNGKCELDLGENLTNCPNDCKETPSITNCFDADGFNTSTFGYVEYNDVRYEDVCENGQSVREYYCGLNFWKMSREVKSSVKSCKYNCDAGACVNQEEAVYRKCADNDVSNNLSVKGNVVFENNNYFDKCEENDLSVRQYFCVGDKLRNFVKRCPAGKMCGDGVCD